MGSFYANVVVVGATVDQVAAVVPGPALLAADGDVVAAFCAADEPQPTTAAALAAALGCPVVAAAVFDDDLLVVEAHGQGRAVELAVPDPDELFGDDEPTGGPGPGPAEAAALVAVVGRGDPDAVAAVLGADVLFASDRHGQLLGALGLPTWAAGWGHRYLSEEPGAFPGPALVAVG